MTKVWAADETDVTETTVAEVDPTSVPEPGGFGDLLMRAQQNIQLFLAKTDDQKLVLEEKFAATYEAQLARLEALPENNPNKQKLIDLLQQRHDERLASIEERAQKLTDKKEEIQAKFDELKARFETRKEEVEAKKAEREQLQEERKQRLEQRLEEMKRVREASKSNYMKTQEKIQEKTKERMENLKQKQEAADEKAKQKAEQVKERAEKAAEAKAKTIFKDRVEGNAPLSVEDTGAVQGAIDYQPTNWLERIGYTIAGW